MAPPFGLSAQRRADPFGPLLVTALREAGADPETFLPEYGRDQFEIVCGPSAALAAADRAVTIREVTRELAAQFGWKATFAPKADPAGVGNGVHIHLSFTDLDGNPVTFDANRPGRLSERAGAFAAGIVRHLPALTAFTAPTVLSYMRLQPHHWAAAWTTMGDKDREATLRICPTSERPGYDPSRASVSYTHLDVYKRQFMQRVHGLVIPNQVRMLNAFRAAGENVLHTVIESLTADGRDRSLDHKLSDMHVPKGCLLYTSRCV